VLRALYRAFDGTDASLAEINPLVVTGDGRVVALDAKLNFDSNALFRHPEIVAMRDLDEEDRPRSKRRIRPLVHLARRQHRPSSTARVSRWRRWT
jgi:succinyl-CoA synthetase beta subunit